MGASNLDIMALRGTVAVVADDPDTLTALGTWLDQSGVKASLHGSPESLVQAITPASQPPLIRLQAHATEAHPLGCVLVDLTRPGVSGLTLAWALRGHHPHLPLVLITSEAPSRASRTGRLPPGIVSLQKPMDPHALKAALLAALR